MKLIACQTDIHWEDKSANQDRVRRLLAGASPDPGALVVLPEMFATGFSMKVARVTEGEERPTERFLADLAREFGVYLAGGLVNRNPDGRGLNQCLVVDPEGREIARYSKMHPFSFAKEDRHYAPGPGPVTFGWQGACVAPTICYDLRFPELYRAGVLAGAQVFTVIANWPARRERHWTSLLVARAIENQAWVVGVNRCGNDPWLNYSGRSLIVNPRGEVVADAGNDECVVKADVDVADLESYRAEFPALQDMRDDLMPAPRS